MTLPIIGSVQLNSQLDIDDNLTAIKSSITAAQAVGTHLLVLPENACRMGGQLELSERFDELSDWYARLAFEHQMFIVAGTIPCPYRPDGTPVSGNRVRQVSQLFAPDGKRIARYDKIHLFRADVADSTGSYDEAQTFEPGDTTVTAECDMANLLQAPLFDGHNKRQTLTLGMMVCFDLRFPALAQRLRQAGADLLSAPSAFTYLTGKAHWELLLRARALDAQCMTVGSAQGGTHHGTHSSRDTWGHSLITNATGEVMVNTQRTALTDENFALVTAELDLEQQTSWRKNLPTNHCHRLA